jgi:hypothetical protein
MARTKQGSWFFATTGRGVYFERFDGRKGFYGEDKLLPSNYCHNLYVHNGSIWVATNKGLSRLVLDTEDNIRTVINYTSQDKLISNEVNDVLFDQGQVYVATNKGISLFSEEISQHSNSAPAIIIDRIQINHKDTLVQPFLRLPFTQNNITIFFSSPSIRSAKNMEYKYVVVGKKNRTVYGVSTAKSIQLGSLPPDEYVLHIWAKNIDGIWSISPARLFVTILQPFWKTIEFILSITVFGVLIVLLLVFLRVRQIQERNKIQALLLASELKALRLHMNPHFIFNTLNSLQKFILERNPLEANKYIAKFARLMRWILSYADKQHITLEEELLFLDTYIELEQLRFDRIFCVRKEIDPTINPAQMYIPALVIQPFVENAIKYGITGIAKTGEIRLVFKKDKEYIKVVIEDNGRGRDAVRNEQALSGKEFESTGIKYTNERLLLLLNPKLEISDAVSVTDLFDDGQAMGTRVELIIPYYNE